jgi:hypothetical protein
MAEHAVSREPVSAENSPVSRENTGNFVGKIAGPIYPRAATCCNEKKIPYIPVSPNREILPREHGDFRR